MRIKSIMVIITLFLTHCCQSQSTTQAFRWTSWNSVSSASKSELKKVIDYKDRTAYDNIIENIESGCTAQLAILDFDNDGKTEYVVAFEGSFCCGSRGCQFIVYKDLGKKKIQLIDEWQSIKPAKTGVISSSGKLIPFKTTPR